MKQSEENGVNLKEMSEEAKRQKKMNENLSREGAGEGEDEARSC
jgi:hypothetical protein